MSQISHIIVEGFVWLIKGLTKSSTGISQNKFLSWWYIMFDGVLNNSNCATLTDSGQTSWGVGKALYFSICNRGRAE